MYPVQGRAQRGGPCINGRSETRYHNRRLAAISRRTITAAAAARAPAMCSRGVACAASHACRWAGQVDGGNRAPVYAPEQRTDAHANVGEFGAINPRLELTRAGASISAMQNITTQSGGL
ncbi:hypothetical protein MRX96_044017 [Rhipicephalus microplus]